MILTATINEVKRRILFDNPQAVVAVKGDYEVNGIAFAFPAIYEDDFDLSTAVKTVYYKATDGIVYNHVVTATDTDTGYPLWVFKDEINKGAFGDVEFALVCDKVEGGNIVKRWVSMITAFRVQKSIEIDESEQEENEQTYSERLADLMTQMANMQATVSGLASGAPTAVSLASGMTDTNKLYVYTGSESGYTTGHWYYYNGSAWADGGLYGGTSVDTTLTVSGAAADAKVTGDKIAEIKEDLSGLPESVEEMGKRLDLTTEGVPNAQIVNTSGIDITNNGGIWGFRNVEFPVSDGKYYHNPIDDGSDTNQRHYFSHGYKFLNANHDEITITQNGTIVSDMSGDRNTCVWVISGTTVTMYMYLTYNDFISEKLHHANVYTLSEEPAYIRATLLALKADASTDKNDAVAGMTKDTWSTEYKPYGGFDYRYTDRLIGAIKDSVDASNSKVIAPMYDATVTYAVNDYVLYGGKLYKCIAAISNAEAWNSAHWEESLLTDEFKDINESLSMCVEEKETMLEPTSGVQCANPSRLRIVPAGTSFRYYYDRIDVSRDGVYYRNPYSAGRELQYVSFFNKYGERLVGKRANGTEVTSLITILNTENAWFIISNSGRCLSTYVRNGERNNEIFFDCEIAYIAGENIRDTDSESWGVTYNEYSDTYIQYDGDQEPASLEKAYNTDVAKFVRDYLGMYGVFVGDDMYNFTYPQKADSVFTKAVKYYMQRFDRERNNIIRFASFNKFVSHGSGNWPDIKKELADYAVDICGFQECTPVTSEGVVTNEIGSYLQSYQFNGYVPQNANVDKALVTHWELSSSDNLTILTYDGGVSTCVRGKMNIIPPLWYSNAISNTATLSVYSCHLSSGGKTIDGTSYSSFETRKKEIEGLLAIIAEDTSDFIVVVGDTNCFETGFDVPTGTHYEWEMFRQAGLTPALPGYESTVTADLANRYFCKADNGKVYCIAAYDQIFFSANVSMDNYGVIDSHRYMMESLANTPISDHCMIYADLKFDFEAVAQNKLKDIAVTQPWW